MSHQEKIARKVVERLRSQGHIAWYAGGCVRDRFLGRTPADYDVATDADADAVQSIFPRTVAVGAHFGVVCVIDDDVTVQVASFRSDGRYIDGRHPVDVTPATPREDAERRDFTINGMFWDPIGEELIDYVGGQADLERKLVRAIGDPASRFREDKLRLLRAVRFATTLEFEVEEQTWAAVRALAPEIVAISAERIREELIRIFVSPYRVRGLDLLEESGLLAVILPEIEALKGCEQPPQFHPEGDVYVHTRIMLGLLPPDAPLPLVLSVLFHDIGKPPTFQYDEKDQRIRFSGHDKVGARMTGELMQRLRFSREQIDQVVEAVDQHMVFKDVQKMRVSRLKRFMARPNLPIELELHRVDCESSHGGLENYEFLKQKAEEFAREPIIPQPLITGHDLIALGWKPGPAIGAALEAVQTRQLEGELHTREEALEWVEREFEI
jgi:tRNA nucleotidyltransferase/poly(A) polymerase